MSIFNRIYRIISANLGQAWQASETAGDPDHRQNTASDSTGDEAPGRQDPLLAEYYANLEVPYGADLETVRAAWKRLLREYHPDRHSQNPEKQHLANELVQKLNHAYQELEKHLQKS